MPYINEVKPKMFRCMWYLLCCNIDIASGDYVLNKDVYEAGIDPGNFKILKTVAFDNLYIENKKDTTCVETLLIIMYRTIFNDKQIKGIAANNDSIKWLKTPVNKDNLIKHIDLRMLDYVGNNTVNEKITYNGYIAYE